MSMTHDEVRQIAERTLDVDPRVHADHHRWVEDKRLEEAEERAMRRSILKSGIGWAFPLFLGYIALVTWRDIVARIGALVK
jgi:hypothetical protein